MSQKIMKRIIFLIIFLILGLIPFHFSFAITQNQIKATVQILCPDNYGNWSSGSGTIIDPKGIILTNKHVVTGQYGEIIKTCFIGFTESINQEPDFGPRTDRNLAEVKYYTAAEDMDAAILYLNNPSNKNYSYVNIWDSNSDSLKFGDKLEVVGFPGIGGSTITYSSGDFSGFGSRLARTQNYIKTTAWIGHGNSGGASYNSHGLFTGVPTMSLIENGDTMNYLLSVNSIKDWLSGILGSGYQKEIIEQKPVIELVPPKTHIQKDITPPTIFAVEKIIFHGNETGEDIPYYNRIEDDSDITVRWPMVSDENGVAGYYVYFGTNPNANPVADGIFTQKTEYNKKLYIPGNYYFIIAAKDQYGNISPAVIVLYNYKVYPKWITDDPMQYLLVTNRPTYFNIYDYSNGTKGNMLKEIKFDSSKIQEVSVPSHNILIEWNGAQNKDFITQQEVYFDTNGQWPLECGGEYKTKNNMNMSFEDWNACVNRHYIKINNNQFIGNNLQVNKPYHFHYKYYFTYENHINENGGTFHPFIIRVTKKTVNKENDLVRRLKGYILLQIESHGEAWYVNPINGKRYYLGRPADAFQIMRELGLGVSHDFVAKYKNGAYPDNVIGKILIDVGDSGKAYYIYPKNKRAYYLGRPADAFRVMRELGLGTSNNDLEKIVAN